MRSRLAAAALQMPPRHWVTWHPRFPTHNILLGGGGGAEEVGRRVSRRNVDALEKVGPAISLY